MKHNCFQPDHFQVTPTRHLLTPDLGLCSTVSSGCFSAHHTVTLAMTVYLLLWHHSKEKKMRRRKMMWKEVGGWWHLWLYKTSAASQLMPQQNRLDQKTQTQESETCPPNSTTGKEKRRSKPSEKLMLSAGAYKWEETGRWRRVKAEDTKSLERG